jgi:hypothetical protein
MNFCRYAKEDLRKKKQNEHCLAFFARASAKVRYTTPYITPHRRFVCHLDSQRVAAVASFHAAQDSSLYLITS